MRTLTKVATPPVVAALTTGALLLGAPTASAHDGTPCDGRADACVDLSSRQAWLMRDGEVYYGPVPVNTGKRGYRTPVGDFSVQWKDKDHKSQEYDNAPMPYSVFFTDTGIAFHEGDISRQSHGCVRMTHAGAKTFFRELQVGEAVQVRR